MMSDDCRRLILEYATPAPSSIAGLSACAERPILVIGMGGGNDIYSCLPWLLWLQCPELNPTPPRVVLANYSFTDDLADYSQEPRFVVRVDGHTRLTRKNRDYFPERDLALAIKQPVHAFRLVPFPQLEHVVDRFVSMHGIQTIILVDGGVDAMLFGDERPYGSPLEDSQMFMACTNVAVKRGIPCHMVCNALHVDDVEADAFVRHWQEFSQRPDSECVQVEMDRDDPMFQEYKRIVQSIPVSRASIVHESIVAAVEGHRGRYANPRLVPHRIAPEDVGSSAPDLKRATTVLWWSNPLAYRNFSPFYRMLSAADTSNGCNLAEDAIAREEDNVDIEMLLKMSQAWNSRVHTALQRCR